MYTKLLTEYEQNYAVTPNKREFVKAVCSSKIRWFKPNLRKLFDTSSYQKKCMFSLHSKHLNVLGWW